MTDEAPVAPALDAAQPSQILGENDAPNLPAPSDLPPAEAVETPSKPLSTRDAVAKALDDFDKAEEPEAKKPAENDATSAKKAEKVEKAVEAKEPEAEPAKAAEADDKAAKPEDPQKAEPSVAEKPAAERSAPDDRQSEGRKHAEPPARFLPEARSKWNNVPNEVKAEFHRVAQEYETELAEHKQYREGLKDYEDLARQHNVTIKGSLDRYVAADRALNEDFGKGVSALIQMYGHNPAQAIVSILAAQGVTPQQYAEFVTTNPQASAPIQQATQPARNDASPQVERLAGEVEALKAQLVWQTRVQPAIDAFSASRPDFQQVWPQMQAILSTKIIDQMYGTGLQPEQKLAEAYRMAGGSMLPSRSDPAPAPLPMEAAPAPVHFDAPKARPVDPDGQKSIRGAPTSGQTGQPQWVPKSNREALERAFASAR